MRKAFIIIAVILLIGVSGCKTTQVTPGVTNSSTPEAEVLPTQDAPSEADIANASNIATAINAYYALNPDSVPLPDNTTLEEAKEIVDEQLWPQGLSDEDARAAWELIMIKGGVAELTPEAWEAAQRAAEKPEQTLDAQTLIYANASNIATAINAYNALNPNSVLPDDITLEQVKETLVGEQLWPSKLSDDDAREAWKYIVIKDGVADLKE